MGEVGLRGSKVSSPRATTTRCRRPLAKRLRPVNDLAGLPPRRPTARRPGTGKPDRSRERGQGSQALAAMLFAHTQEARDFDEGPERHVDGDDDGLRMSRQLLRQRGG